MTVLDTLKPALGRWTGTMRMRMLPTDEYIDSEATANVAVRGGAYISISYTWSHEGNPQDGMILIGRAMREDGVHAVWVDSWHAAPEWMSFAAGDAHIGLLLEGTYPAAEGPDWGWCIRIEPGGDPEVDGTAIARGDEPASVLRIVMDNIVPGHVPYHVVDLTLQRA